MNKLFPILALLFFSCDEDNPVTQNVYGCTDNTACNFNPDANIYVPNSCIYGQPNICNECGDNYNCLLGEWNYESQTDEYINNLIEGEDCLVQLLDYVIFEEINIYSNGKLNWSLYNWCDELWDWNFNNETSILGITCNTEPNSTFEFEIEFNYTNNILTLISSMSQTDEVGNSVCTGISRTNYSKAE